MEGLQTALRSKRETDTDATDAEDASADCPEIDNNLVIIDVVKPEGANVTIIL